MPRKKEVPSVPEIPSPVERVEPEPAPPAQPPRAIPPAETGAPQPYPTAGPALPTKEERGVAAAAHAGILLNLITGIGGPVLALILWLLYEHKSRYAGWHAIQALVFQVIVFLLTLLFGGLTALLWFLTVVLMRIVVGYCLLPFTIGFSLILATLVIGSLIYGCAGAMAALEGRDFRYRWISDWISPEARP